MAQRTERDHRDTKILARLQDACPLDVECEGCVRKLCGRNRVHGMGALQSLERALGNPDIFHFSSPEVIDKSTGVVLGNTAYFTASAIAPMVIYGIRL